MLRRIAIALCLISFWLPIGGAYAAKPIATDSRIKTFVYNENEVFRIVVHYGYHTSIEFAEGEQIQTISVGNNYAWQMSPLGRRLFIKPLEENILTNMTIITNLHTYQFELQSKLLSYTIDEELVYVVRFFYPDNGYDQIKPIVKQAHEYEPIPVVRPYNFNYTLSGPSNNAPTRVFDDGVNTFFKFSPKLANPPQIAVQNGYQMEQLVVKQQGDYYIVNLVAKEFELNVGGQIITAYNEAN